MPISAAPPPASTSAPREYVLGTGLDELQRLGFQHRLWADAAHAAWRKAQVRLGQRVLDVGCGPGFASFDLAQLVGPEGRVVGVDESPAFINHLQAQAASRGLANLSGFVGDVQDLTTARAHGPFDLAYERWVLCFVPRPDDVVASVASLLKRGGRFVIHDYFNYGSMTMAPRRPSHDKAVAATIASWRSRGGDPDICGRLPAMLTRHGFTIEHLAVHQRLARGHDTMFQWVDVWWRIYAPKLVEMNLLSQADCDQLMLDLAAVRDSPTDFVMPPPVYELIAVKQ